MKRRMAAIGQMHQAVSKILRKKDRKSYEYIDDFSGEISQLIGKLEVFPYHIIWEYISEKVPGNLSVEENHILRDVTQKHYRKAPLEKNDFFDYPRDEYFRVPLTKKELSKAFIDYFKTGTPAKVFEIPLKPGYSHFNLPVFSENEQMPQWILTLVYREDNIHSLNDEGFFEFMEHLSQQIGMAWDKFQENIANKIHKKIDYKTGVGEKAESTSIEEELRIISKVLASEFRADYCAFFFVNEKKNTVKMEFSNIEFSCQLKTSASDTAATCYKENKTLRFIAKESFAEEVKLIEHCLCIPIIIGKSKLGAIALLRSDPIDYQYSKDKFEYEKPPFSEIETDLLKTVQRYISGIIISYFTVQRRMKDLQSFIEQVKAPIESLVGEAKEIIKRKVPMQKIFEKLTYINNLSKVALEYAANFEKILEFDTQQIHLRKEKLYDLREYLIGIAIENRSLFRTKCISINVTKKTADNINIYVDKGLFRHAISTIVDNTIKYSFSPEERQRFGFQAKPSSIEDEENVLITAIEKNNFVIITISSLGLEILEDEKDKIFNKEFRGVKAVERFRVGTGSGLYIAKKIIELHNGKLELEPHTNKYKTVFKITLPKGEVDI
jgi:signal transduction histidine kinase